MSISAKGFRLGTSLVTAGQVDVNEPAKIPYAMQKMYNMARLSEKPQSRSTASVLPTVERRMHVA